MPKTDKSQGNQVQKHSNEQILFQNLSELEASDINPNPTPKKIIDTDESQRKSQEIAPAIYMGSPQINQIITEGSFVVLANSQQGTYFQNFSSGSRKVRFNAQGNWIIASSKFSAKGSGTVFVNDSPVGCLLIRRFIINDNRSRHSLEIVEFCDNSSGNDDGKIEKDILLSPMETLCFFPNCEQGNKDNQGYLVVDWTLVE
ncbi:hypothetical protein [Microcoleus sp. B4-C1]|uniref:hypothetical protein n=1 Tax=Microcoleus sp. B4-C1 TaxID=2818660 RepID=UPI002FD24B8D